VSGSAEHALTAFMRIGSRALYRIPSDLPLPWPVKRRWTELVATVNTPPRGLRRSTGRIAGVRAERLEPRGGAGGVLLYLHGGGYVQGSPRVQRAAAAHLALASGATSYSPDYRLAPEHPFPAAFEDCLAVCRVLVERYGAGSVAIAGDSAGAGLAHAVAIAARDEGSTPAGLFLICPWADLATDRSAGPDTDPILSRKFLVDGADAYLGDRDRTDPRCSPVRGDLAGLPPIVIHTATEDPLRPDAEQLAEVALGAGVEVELEEFPLWHDFHLHAAVLRRSREALERGGAFLRARLSA
jgi:monoterpene epsilon-lactone hydrolase